MNPLSNELRPKLISEVVGQPHLTGEDGFLTQAIKKKKALSIILWGPPGVGKTSIARLYAKAFEMPFYSISGATDSISDLKKIIKEHGATPLFGKTILLFVDEIHRFNKAQQDAFLPLIENGDVVLVGATAENPSFYLNPALLSRTRVLTLNPLDEEALSQLISRYESLKGHLDLNEDERAALIQESKGDGRYLYNMIENFYLNRDLKHVQKRTSSYDKKGDHHYNTISALHKSVRGSDPDAALYWFCRMIDGGEDPLFLARRLIRMASEDIGLADPNALPLAIAARDAYDHLGSPEGELALAEVVIYLALAPKSNRTYTAYGNALKLARETAHLAPPMTILNAPTKLMKNMGYGKDYNYDHEAQDAFSGQEYFPDAMKHVTFYEPVERGFERELIKRIDYFNKLRQKRKNS